MSARVRVLPVFAQIPRGSLGAYAPAAGDASPPLQGLVDRTARDVGPHVFSLQNQQGAELELATTFVRLEPDQDDRPFACAQVLIEVRRKETAQVVYTRKIEVETRRLVQLPVPLDDVRFDKTALGRATLSCLRAMFSGVVETFALT